MICGASDADTNVPELAWPQRRDGGAGYLLRKNSRVIGYIREGYLKPFGRIGLLLIAPSRRNGAAPMYCLDFHRQGAPHPERLLGRNSGFVSEGHWQLR